MDEIAANHLVIYFDPEMEDYDGLGWCMEMYPGSVTYRFESLASLTQAIRFQQDFLNPNCREFVV